MRIPFSKTFVKTSFEFAGSYCRGAPLYKYVFSGGGGFTVPLLFSSSIFSLFCSDVIEEYVKAAIA